MFLIESSNDGVLRNGKLIAEKMAMPSHECRFARVRLRVMLEKSLASCTSTIISGRAGTGKTVLAQDFALNCGRPVAWYKVDAPEGEIENFFEYLIASIRRERRDFGRKALIPLIRTSERHQITNLADAFVYELAEGDGKPLLIVIDDLHLVSDAAWLVPFFGRLLPLLPSEVHVMITSRTMPPAPLWRMRSKQTLSVIEEGTLAFTRDEALQLFESYGLSSELAGVALDHTHGRASALARFAASRAEKRFPGPYARNALSEQAKIAREA